MKGRKTRFGQNRRSGKRPTARLHPGFRMPPPAPEDGPTPDRPAPDGPRTESRQDLGFIQSPDWPFADPDQDDGRANTMGQLEPGTPQNDQDRRRAPPPGMGPKRRPGPGRRKRARPGSGTLAGTFNRFLKTLTTSSAGNRNSGQGKKPRSIQSAITGGVCVILVTFGGFGTWAMSVELSSAVIASGVLTVSGKSKTVQHLEGGIVRDILVRDGDVVDAGAPLIRLHSTKIQAGHATVRNRLDNAWATVARLTAERDNADALIFPPELTSRANEAHVNRILAGQQAAFETRRNLIFGRINLNRQQISQLREEIRGLQGQASSAREQIELLNQEIQGLEELLAKGFAARNRVVALQRERARLEGERARHDAAVAKAYQAISETELQITQEWTRYQDEVMGELEDWQRQVFELTNEMDSMTDSLERTEIVAPVRGTIVGLSVHTPGAVIAPGEVLLEIVPASDRLVVEAQVQPQDIESVSVGLPSDVQLSAFSQKSLGNLEGTVVYVSADSFMDDRTGLAHYVANIEIDDTVVQEEDLALQPGMPATVFIKTGGRSPFSYLVGPLTDSLSRAWRET